MMKQLLSAIALSSLVAMAAEYYVEGEHMPVKGGWTMNSERTYLTGNVKDTEAKGEFFAGEAGEMTLWVKTMTFNEGWRKCEIIINDVSYGTFGDAKGTGVKKGDFCWNKGLKKVAVKTGKNTVVVKATSPMARFDALVLTSDDAFDPKVPRKLVEGAKPLSLAVKGVDFDADAGWQASASLICCMKGGAIATAVVEAAEPTNVIVWGQSVSHGGNTRKVSILVNGEYAGKFGDESLNGQKAGAQIWAKCANIVHLNKGENVITAIGSPYGRLVKLVLTNDAKCEPASVK